MTREEAIWCIKHELLIYVNRKDLTGQAVGEALDMAIEALQAEPTKAVPPSLADVYKWERDIVLSQLEEYGIGFAEKKRDDLVEVVRCKDCKNWRESHSEDEESYCYIDGRTTDSTDYCSWGELAEHTEYKLPGYDEIMEKLDELTLKGGDHE